MGLLDPKSRIMDVVLTDQGRQSLSRNQFKVAYYSVSDSTVFYQNDVSGSSDVTSRIYFECASDLPQDIISLPVNGNRQVSYVRSTSIPETDRIYGGKMLRGTSSQLTGSAFISGINNVLSSSLENYRNNFIIGTVDDFFEDDTFEVSPQSVSFMLSDDRKYGAISTARVSSLENFFQDPLLSNVDNFAYLPPINKPTDSSGAAEQLGDYASLGGNIEMTYADIVEELKISKSKGACREFSFDPAPRSNNIHMQIFEQASDQLVKLDVVDFGTHRDAASGNPVRVLFAGKVYLDDYGMQTFVRMFTVVLE